MKKVILTGCAVLFSASTFAVTPAEDVASTINLNGHACGSKASGIKETKDGSGNKTITAKCENGKRYQIKITANGRVSVKPL